VELLSKFKFEVDREGKQRLVMGGAMPFVRDKY
jgi:hypothetical protein